MFKFKIILIFFTCDVLILLSYTVKAHKIKGKRSSLEIKPTYFVKNRRIELKCFDDQPADDDIGSYSWKVGGYDLDEEEIRTYKDYDFMEQKGDIVIKAPDEEKNASCTAEVLGETAVQMQYMLLLARTPNVTILINEKERSSDLFQTVEGKLAFECWAKNGRPLSNITIILNENELNSVIENETLRVKIENLDYTYNRKSLTCIVDSFVKKIKKNVTLNVLFAPREEGETIHSELEIGKPLNITFSYKSNPVSNITWSHSTNCSHSEGDQKLEENYILGDHKESGSSEDNFIAVIHIKTVRKEDLNRCILLTVRNDQGSKVFRFSIPVTHSSSDDGLGGGTIAVIVIVIVLVLVLILLGLLLSRKWRPSFQRRDPLPSSDLGL